MIRALTEHAQGSLALIKPRFLSRSEYTRDTLFSDLLAGLTSAAILIPNAMAYALLAGLSPITGLYAALPAVIFASLWGSSSFVITGPVGIVSLLTVTSLVPFAEVGSPEFITLAIALAALAGIIQLALGLLRLGFLAQLIPHSVIVGFAAAAALIIGLVQLPNLLGFSVVQKEHVIDTLFAIVRTLPDIHFPTALLGLTLLTVLFFGKRLFPHFPVALTVLGASLGASYVFNFSALGIATIGMVPAGIPSLSFAAFSIPTFLIIAKKALVIAIVGFVETYSIGKSLAHNTDEKISADKELVGQGLANIGASIAGGYPVSGSFSVSAINKNAGAKTAYAGVAVGAAILVVLIAIAPLLSFLPKVALAAIIITAVMPLVTIRSMRELYHIARYDGIIAGLTFTMALIFKPDDAIIIGIVAALMLLIHRIMWADVHEVGVHETWHTLRRTDDPLVKTYPHVLIVRIDASLVYANAERIVARIEALCSNRSAHGDTVRALICNLSGVNTMDASGVESVHEIVTCAKKRNAALAVVNMKGQIRSMLERAGLTEDITYLHNMEELTAYCEQMGSATPPVLR